MFFKISIYLYIEINPTALQKSSEKQDDKVGLINGVTERFETD